MTSSPNWKLIDEATRSLTGRGCTPFTRQQVYEEIWRGHPECQRGSLDPTFQGMVSNASGGPPSAGGTPLRRVERGLYVRRVNDRAHSCQTAPAARMQSDLIGDEPRPPGEPRRGLLAGSLLVTQVLQHLATRRPVFHSEADLQQAFAWQLHLLDPSLHVRLETRPAPGMRLDLLVSDAGRSRHTAIEFKYLTKRWAGEVEGERYELKDQGAQDISGYDTVKDIWRVEKFTREKSEWNGAVVCLSNDPYYWSPPRDARPTNAADFRLHDGVQLSGVRAWGPLTGKGTRSGREADLALDGSYALHWQEYSALPASNGVFRVLVIPVAGQSLSARPE